MSHYPQPGAYPPPKKTRKWPWIVGGIVLAFILFAACAGQSSPTAPVNQSGQGATSALTPAEAAPPAEQAAPTVIKAKQLGDAFEANQIAAEAEWAGKYVQFTAPVSNINSSGITFTDVTSEFSFTQISCGVQDEAAVVKLIKGKPVTVRGIVGSDQMLGVISLDQCQIVS